MTDKPHYIEPSTGVVHLKSEMCGGEYTLCGLAFDEPASERGEECMEDSDAPCNCPECIETAKRLLPYLQREMRRLKKDCGANKKERRCGVTIEEISPEQFILERYSMDLLWRLDDALRCAIEFGYCDASRLAVRPKSGEYALMITWGNGGKNWCHIDARMLKIIRKRLAKRADRSEGGGK